MRINADKVAEVIILARDMARNRGQFESFITGLRDEEKASLVAIMWIGRDSFDASEWDEAFETALDEATTPTQDYLRGSPHLADHLENGLDALGVSASSEEDELY
ncbi:Protein of unknown function [Octadecabacter temperatus]|uniref:Uncharacterized protein n=1 Tax=Octadecabacter temperatus TaxID=1458307 RepID=A0A0K0Y9G4_9RHOB|nr:DUF3775 domain-containing protein [Octadecabacter temperatus]AKS47512.1 hypothetical protein OSB_29960 [Octadecabacter temperatus]SIO41843.1 Protein of unknown function [Octadecabacter temperatus]